MKPLIRVRLLGTPAITSNGSSILVAEKHLLILAMLARSEDRCISRGKLASLIWPSVSARSARHSLSQGIYTLRKVTGANILESDNHSLRWGDASCDVIDFEESYVRQEWESAARLYTGAFLDGLTGFGHVDLEHWIEEERSFLNQRAIDLLNEPLREDTRHDLAGLLLEHVPEEALPKRHLFSALSDPLDGNGGASLTDKGHSVGCQATYSPRPFIGRRRELRELVRLLEAAHDTGFQAVALEGEPGIGKSALARRFLGTAVLRGAAAFQAIGFEAERNVALGVLQQLLRDGVGRPGFALPQEPWRSILLRSFPFLDPSPRKPDFSVDERGMIGLMEAAKRLFCAVATERIVVITVDDAHWADSASLACLHFLAREAAKSPIILVVCARKGEWNTKPRDFDTIELNGLSNEETNRLLLNLGSALDKPEADRVYRLSAGNPFLIHTMVDDIGHFKRAALPPSAVDIYSRRLEVLSQPAVEVAAALAIVGGVGDLSLLEQIIEDDEPSSILEELDRLTLVDFSEGKVSLRHGIIGEAVLAKVSPGTRAALHGRVARALMQRGKPPAVVADQFAMAGHKAPTYRAAMNAARASGELNAARESEYFLRIAISSAPTVDKEIEARIELADLLLTQGRATDAQQLLELETRTPVSFELGRSLEAYSHLVRIHGLPQPDVLDDSFESAKDLVHVVAPILAAKLFVAIGAAAHQQGRTDLASTASRAGLQALLPEPVGPERIRQECAALVLCEIHDGGGNRAALDDLVEQAKTWPAAFLSALYSRAVLRITEGEPSAAERDLLDALEVGERYGLLDQLARIHNNLGVLYMEQGKFVEAERYLKLALKVGQVVPRVKQTAQSNLALLEYERGALEQALAAAGQCIESGETYRSPRPYLAGLSIKGLAALELGQLSAARDCERQIRMSRVADEAWSHDVSYLEIFLARMALFGGDVDEALRRLAAKVESFRKVDFYCASRMEVEYVRLLTHRDARLAQQMAAGLRLRLAKARARPLVERLDSIMTRVSGLT